MDLFMDMDAESMSKTIRIGDSTVKLELYTNGMYACDNIFWARALTF